MRRSRGRCRLPIAMAWTTTRPHTTTMAYRRRTTHAIDASSRLFWSSAHHPIIISRHDHEHHEHHDHHPSRLFLSTTRSSSDHPITDDGEVYKELQWLSKEIRRHDEIYYNTGNGNNTQQEPELSDDEFDALVQREEQLAEEYPHLLQQWQEESGWGVEATRKGRVGSREVYTTDSGATGTTTSDDDTVESSSLAATTASVPNDTQQEAQSQKQKQLQEPRLKRKHLAPMLSLDNVHNDEQLWAWLKRIPKVLDEWDSEEPTRVTIVTEPKLDGVSLSLRYNNSSPSSSPSSYELEWASTRGDGQQGQDVTFAVRSMGQTIPLHFTTDHHLNLPSTIEIRGEVVLPNSHFEKLSDWAPNVTFSNARNAASGILLRKESEIEEGQLEADKLRSKLQFYAYDMVADTQGQQPLPQDGNEIQRILSDIGFSIPLPVSKTELDLKYNETMEGWSNETISPMLTYYQALQKHRDEHKTTKGYDWGDFEMDGCVHKISESTIRRLLGRSMKSPKWAVAHKFPPRAVVTKLLNVTVQIGRTGALTPVAELDPVTVGGVTIQRATLHNFGHLQQVLGGTETAVGTSVLVRRAGDVIPQVVQRVGDPIDSTGVAKEDMISLKPPTQCPACGSSVILEEIATSATGQVARCGGPPLLCPPRAVTSLVHAFSRDAMDVTGLSEARIQQLMDASLLRFPSDIFQFGDEEWNQVQELPGWGPKSCQNLRASSQSVATTGISLSRFIFSLGARHLGKHSSELVASRYATKEAFFKALDAASDWTEIEAGDNDEAIDHPFSALQGQLGIGPVLIQSLVSFSKSKELVDAAKALGKAVKVLDEEATTEDLASEMSGISTNKAGRNLPWKGFRVVFTGSIPSYSRSDAHKAAKFLGAKATPGSVSKSTDLVVFGDKGGKKLEQAETLGIRTMPAEEFIALVEQNSATAE